MNADKLIEEEIKERIAAGNRSFFANKKIFQNKLITKKNQRKAVSYGNQTSSSIWIRMLGINRKHQAEIIGIRKEVIEKKFWSKRRKQMENGDKKQTRSWKT